MIRALAIVFAVLSAGPASAQDANPLAQYEWEAMPLILFADTGRDPRLLRQLAELEDRIEELDERDVIIIVDTEEESALRDMLHPRGYGLVLVGMDGRVKLRRPDFITVRELTRLIDRMTL